MTLAELTREGARLESRCEAWLDGALVDELPIVGGSVDYDASRAVLRHCDVELNAAPPASNTDPLAPSGSWLKLYRGARDWTGELIEEPVGVYAFDRSDIEFGDRVLVMGYDFSRLVRDARWEEPYEVAAGTATEDAIGDALLARLPFLAADDLNFASTGATTPAILWGEERDNDPWSDLVDLARAAGMLLYFERDGRPTMTPVPDPDEADIVWDYTRGTEPTYVSAARALHGRAYNVVVARGEPADDAEAVQATAEDDNPASASYVGRYRRPYFLTSGYIATEGQAQNAANGELRRRVGLGEVATIVAVPNPLLDAWAIVKAVDPKLGLDARFVLDRITLPLRPAEMTLVTRRRRV